MAIKRASKQDLSAVVSLTSSCTQNLIEQGIYQWNKAYPSKEVLKNDIELKQLWKFEVEAVIVGIIVLTEIEDEDYKKVKWLTNSSNSLYIHRLAVHPNYQGKGFAIELMNFAENYALRNNFTSIRLDTFSKNKRNQRFYEKRNYKKLENIYFLKQSQFPFYCYELVLNAKN